MNDIFGNKVNVGDTVAVGMSYGRSSVLRVGQVVSIKETPTYMNSRTGVQQYKFSVRMHWTHNGSGAHTSWGEVKDSTILHESSHTFAKMVLLPAGYAEQYPSDVTS